MNCPRRSDYAVAGLVRCDLAPWAIVPGPGRRWSPCDACVARWRDGNPPERLEDAPELHAMAGDGPGPSIVGCC